MEDKKAKRRRLFEAYIRENRVSVITKAISIVLMFAVVVYICRDRYMDRGIFVAVLFTAVTVANDAKYYRDWAARKEEEEKGGSD